MKTLSTSQKKKVALALNTHEKFANAYFWRPIEPANSRRRLERENSFAVSFTHEGTTYKYESGVSCSCKNVYYTGKFFVDGERKNVRAFKNLI